MFPVLLYGLECCQLNNADLQSLDFTLYRLFMKLFKTDSINVVQECRSYFGIKLPSSLTKKKQDKFLINFYLPRMVVATKRHTTTQKKEIV